MISCPHCGHELTSEEQKALRAALNGAVISEKKAKSSAENGRKGGRPKKVLTQTEE